MTVHYENNNAFLTVTSLERAIEVSHWGVISVEEVIDLRHTGAILKGSFSRYEYQRDQNGVSSVKSFRVNTLDCPSWKERLTCAVLRIECSSLGYALCNQSSL